tara:strand:- start:160 stop:279 length:120 start_codon:yes stop_codon:yes gene_type:complete
MLLVNIYLVMFYLLGVLKELLLVTIEDLSVAVKMQMAIP